MVFWRNKRSLDEVILPPSGLRKTVKVWFRQNFVVISGPLRDFARVWLIFWLSWAKVPNWSQSVNKQQGDQNLWEKSFWPIIRYAIQKSRWIGWISILNVSSKIIKWSALFEIFFVTVISEWTTLEYTSVIWRINAFPFLCQNIFIL